MKIKILVVLAIAALFCLCFEGAQGPTGPKGSDGKDFIVHDTVVITRNNPLRISANKTWMKSGIQVKFGDKVFIKSSTNMQESFAVAGLSGLISNQQINSLYLKVGSSGPVKVNKSYVGLAQDDGEIEFGINSIEYDTSQYFSVDSLVINR
jgi:hypothetical protein